MTSGSWKDNPNPTKYHITKSRYESVEIRAVSSLELKVDRNPRALGSTRKYAKPIPQKRRINEQNMRVTILLVDKSLGSAGLMKAMVSNMSTGVVSKKPKITDILRMKSRAPAGDV
jgi:hypothetical protein